MFYIFHGEDELTRSEQIAAFKAKLGDPALGDLNITVLDGRKLSMGELHHACDAIPFLADKRLVIVEGLLSRLGGRAGKKGDNAAPQAVTDELLAYLPRLPESTRLVLVEACTLKANHPVVKLALSIDKRCVHEFKLPQGQQLARWVVKRAQAHGGQIEAPAASLLVEFSSGDLRGLDQDIQKLLAYVNWSRPVTAGDVRALVHDVKEGNVFAMVDALAQGNGQAAAGELHRLLDAGEAPLLLFSMVIRQFRLLILLKELAEENVTGDEAAAQLHIHPFVAKKLGEQARAFTMGQMESIYRSLQEMDVAIKRGQIEDSTALDVLVAGLNAR
ncbi:MAG: DNA polymerase III subunit delta [Thermoflexales bacterium]|nr:DNA polymerase III subunit delta [Thermoflexales bacterium]